VLFSKVDLVWRVLEWSLLTGGRFGVGLLVFSSGLTLISMIFIFNNNVCCLPSYFFFLSYVVVPELSNLVDNRHMWRQSQFHDVLHKVIFLKS